MSGRWAAICQDDWQDLFPDEYFPDTPDYRVCSLCNETRLTVNVLPEKIEDAQAKTEESQ